MKYYIVQKCDECGKGIDFETLEWTSRKYGIGLCRKCRNEVGETLLKSTKYTVALYYELKKRNIPAELEKFDGYKTIDISIPQAKINIEVDGKHHNTDKEQAMKDLIRTYHSFMKGYYTIRIPNNISYMLTDIEKTAYYLEKIIKKRLEENKEA